MSASPSTALEVYAQTVRSLPLTERLRLAALILDELARPDVAVVDTGDGWSTEDRRDVTAFSLRYAENIYPEGEELV
jgi:hypothetical protein